MIDFTQPHWKGMGGGAGLPCCRAEIDRLEDRRLRRNKALVWTVNAVSMVLMLGLVFWIGAMRGMTVCLADIPTCERVAR